LVTAGNDLLPRESLDPVRFSTVWLDVAGCLALLIVVALILLWIRQRSVLDLWLMVVMCAYLIERVLHFRLRLPSRVAGKRVGEQWWVVGESTRLGLATGL